MDRFQRAFALLAVHEGGYVNHPDDPGGATNRGVTQRTYDNYLRRHDRATRSVKLIADSEVSAIYRNQYWNAIRADDLPEGVAYCVFDAAVNSGPSRAVRWLQSVTGAQVDGVVGDETVNCAVSADQMMLVDVYCDQRLAFMRRLRHWSTFKRGWTRRVAEVRAQSKAWIVNAETESREPPTPTENNEFTPVELTVSAKAQGPESATATLRDTLTDTKSLSAVAGTLGSAGSLLSGHGPVQYAIAIIMVLAALTGIWWLVRGREA